MGPEIPRVESEVVENCTVPAHRDPKKIKRSLTVSPQPGKLSWSREAGHAAQDREPSRLPSGLRQVRPRGRGAPRLAKSRRGLIFEQQRAPCQMKAHRDDSDLGISNSTYIPRQGTIFCWSSREDSSTWGSRWSGGVLDAHAIKLQRAQRGADDVDVSFEWLEERIRQAQERATK